ncbi:MAG: ATP phosphoribosyltransferase regulatory subunit [Egibacteraceae bacterium]
MDVANLHSPLTGLSDLYGLPLRKRMFVTATLSSLVRSYGYEQIEVPVVERASSFSENIVGRSPWPEWDKRGCFYLSVPDYVGSYDSPPNPTEALLIPEGTISVTRWLGRSLSAQPEMIFPVKLFYETPCFRNELVDALDVTKRRQFTQFGLEILGAPPGNADVEAIYLIAKCLESLGVDRTGIRVRVGDVAVFNRLVALSGVDSDSAIGLKEALDGIAECKAGKRPERMPQLAEQVEDLLTRAKVASPWREQWLGLAGGLDSIDLLGHVDDEVVRHRLAELRALAGTLATLGVDIDIDLCVVRSHEYYTGIAFEVDARQAGHVFVEIGGGGRYDKLVGHFVADLAAPPVPATGFAFGVERLVHLLERLDLLGVERSVTEAVNLSAASADVLVIPPAAPGGYLAAARAADDVRSAGRSADIFVGGLRDGWQRYATARQVKDIRTLLETQEQ